MGDRKRDRYLKQIIKIIVVNLKIILINKISTIYRTNSRCFVVVPKTLSNQTNKIGFILLINLKAMSSNF